MKRTVTVYDVKITKGPDAGLYRIFGVADKARAEAIAEDFRERWNGGEEVIAREEEIIEFRDQDDMLNWLMQEEE